MGMERVRSVPPTYANHRFSERRDAITITMAVQHIASRRARMEPGETLSRYVYARSCGTNSGVTARS